MPNVSFITGVKNRSAELKETIKSFLNQDIPEWEAIIVDDHSQENIKSIVDDFNDSRLNYYLLPENQKGISNARNLAVKKTNSNIMLIADGDDINLANRARVIYDEMTKNNYDVFYSRVNIYIPNENKKYPHVFQPFDKELFKMINFITNPGVAFRKEIFEKVNGFDPQFSISEDYDLWLRMLDAGAKFGYTEEILVDYRRSTNNTTVNRYNEIHEYIMKTRIKNNIPPFDIYQIKGKAEPEVAKDILSEINYPIWKDDRFKNEL